MFVPFRIFLVLLALCVLAACGGDAIPTQPPSTPYEPSDPVLAQKYQEAGERL